MTNPETVQKNLLAWLLQEPNPDAIQAPSTPDYLQDDRLWDSLDPLDSEDMDKMPMSLRESANFSSHSGTPPLQPGEIPIVQNRFHSLLKRRLQAEIQHHPPLFPWETEIMDYETESRSSSVLAASGSPSPRNVTVDEPVSHQTWITQLRRFNFPMPVPDAVLAHLLEHCQAALQSTLLEGAKLVEIVETLFPGQSSNLNHLAGLVLTGPTRAGQSATLQSQLNVVGGYDAATSAQKMLVSLLAAREILGALTLKVSAAQPKVERQWLTPTGALTVKAHYQSREHSRLRVLSKLPIGGSLKLRSANTSSMAQRVSSGYLSVELFDLQPEQAYPLEIQLAGVSEPLSFAIYPQGESD
ncbi:MAG: hypothetical protein VKJ46_14530 [Leptolyngbyaceae bacterium]|nr:hypothetical protein [Leptolyngbyaceae bacterium]